MLFLPCVFHLKSTLIFLPSLKNIHENMRENVLFQFVLEVRLLLMPLIVDLSTGL